MQGKEHYLVLHASEQHIAYATRICEEMEASANARGTGIARRSPDYIADKMREGKAVIALTRKGEWAGFCYIETWEHGKYVANSGLIVAPAFRKDGLAREIKKAIFRLSEIRYPNAKIFGLTTGLAVMKINSELGYEPVTYSELTSDESFWKGCRSCVNHDILVSKERKNCLCTAMLYDPSLRKQVHAGFWDFARNSKLYERFMRIKQQILLRGQKKHPAPATEQKERVLTFFKLF